MYIIRIPALTKMFEAIVRLMLVGLVAAPIRRAQVNIRAMENCRRRTLKMNLWLLRMLRLNVAMFAATEMA